MIFTHEKASKRVGRFEFTGPQKAVAHSSLHSEAMRELWYGFSFHTSTLEAESTAQYTFQLGYATLPALGNDAYAISVTEQGIAVIADSEKSLAYGYMTLLDMIKMEDSGEGLYIECCEFSESPAIENRMVHFCIFPETELWELEKMVALCAALKYSHLILEFWGMLKYDCLDALSWPHAFGKEDVKRITKRANDMGLEIIPMFNQWGHASAGRMCHGKHVVLDQDPSLQYLFDETGWCWNTNSPKVRALFRRVRAELIEVCGAGEYFHIGCDEAVGFTFTEENMDMICSFVNEIASELAALGRKTIMWGDMLLYRHEEYKNTYEMNCPSLACEEYMLERVDRSIIIADWQYNCRQYPVETALTLQKHGFQVLLCPWDRSYDSEISCLETVKKHSLCGIMHTTWHTLSKHLPNITGVAVSSWGETDFRALPYKTAALMRKTYFVDGNYTRAGWAKQEIGTLWA